MFGGGPSRTRPPDIDTEGCTGVCAIRVRGAVGAPGAVRPGPGAVRPSGVIVARQELLELGFEALTGHGSAVRAALRNGRRGRLELFPRGMRGTGGPARSVRNSITAGPSASSPARQPASTSSGPLHAGTGQPQGRAKSAYGTSGISWEGRNAGAPLMARLPGGLVAVVVVPDAHHVPRVLPPVAALRRGDHLHEPVHLHGPIVAREPDSEERIPGRCVRRRAYQFAGEPGEPMARSASQPRISSYEGGAPSRPVAR